MGSHLLLLAPPPAHMIRKDPVLEAYQQEITYVFHALRWLGARPQEIEDLAQEVFIALRRSWPHYDASRPLRPYLFGVAFRVVSMQRRKRKHEVTFANLEVREGGPGPDEELQAKQARATVLRALEKLPLRRRAVLLMHDLEEVPMAQVARSLSIPLFTAYSRLRKARKELEAAIRRNVKDEGKR
jgi:RNA polymerase sigma-70 factor (ECF subfamily)